MNNTIIQEGNDFRVVPKLSPLGAFVILYSQCQMLLAQVYAKYLGKVGSFAKGGTIVKPNFVTVGDNAQGGEVVLPIPNELETIIISPPSYSETKKMSEYLVEIDKRSVMTDPKGRKEMSE